MLTVSSHQSSWGPIHPQRQIRSKKQQSCTAVPQYLIQSICSCSHSSRSVLLILWKPGASSSACSTQHVTGFPRMFLSMLYSRSDFLWWHCLLLILSYRPTCCTSISRVHFLCMGPALLRLSSSSYCCLTVHLWYLFLSLSLPLAFFQAQARPARRIRAPTWVCACSSGRTSHVTALWRLTQGLTATTVSTAWFMTYLHLIAHTLKEHLFLHLKVSLLFTGSTKRNLKTVTC